MYQSQLWDSVSRTYHAQKPTGDRNRECDQEAERPCESKSKRLPDRDEAQRELALRLGQQDRAIKHLLVQSSVLSKTVSLRGGKLCASPMTFKQIPRNRWNTWSNIQACVLRVWHLRATFKNSWLID